MPELGSVVIALRAVDEASSVMDKIRASCGILSGTLGELGGGFESVGTVISGFAGAGIAGAAIAATGELIQGLKWSVGQAAEAEQAIKNLSVAVEKSGTAWDTVSKATQETLAQMQRVTVYSDEQLAGALQRLLTFGMSYDDAMKALSATVDVAAAKNMDLQSAADLVGKAFMGNTAILQRYGIDVTTSKEATAALKDAVAVLADGIKMSGDGLQGFSSTLEAAGISLTTTEGKMRGAKDIAEELIGAFQSGKIDAEAFDQIMGELGVSIDTTRLKAADFPAVMAALNEQFGGTAQEQAQTYAGIQERFKNAVSDLGEKIGGILLPALSGMTEAMIPVADWFGKGVDAIQAWLTEVGKMPEVQGVMSAVNEAFQGLWSRLEDLWKFIQDTFGPVLQELWQAFKDLWDALSPIGEAFSEILGVFGEGTEGIDLLKAAIMAIAFEIKGFAEIIKAIAPYIRQFAEGFKAAADFIAPILGQIKDAIVGFIDALKNAFQGFYTWLVGGSLWMDLWNALVRIAGQMIGTLLSDLAAKLFEPMKNAFTGAMQAISDLWNKGWDAVQTAFASVSEQIADSLGGFLESAKTTVASGVEGIKTSWETGWQTVQTAFNTAANMIQTDLNNAFDMMKSKVEMSTAEYAPTMTAAMSGMQSAMNAGFDLIKGDWQGALGHIQDALTQFGSAAQGIMTGIMTSLQGAVDEGINTMRGAWDAFVGGLTSGIQQVQSAFGTIASAVQGTVEQAGGAATDAMSTAADAIGGAVQDAASATQSGMGAVSNAFQAAFNTVANAATGFWNWLVGHSLWTDMLAAMQQDTAACLDQISALWTQIFTAIQADTANMFTTLVVGWENFFLTIQTELTTFHEWLIEQTTFVTLQFVTLWEAAWNRIVLDTVAAITQMMGALDMIVSQAGPLLTDFLTNISTAWTETWEGMLAQLTATVKSMQTSLTTALTQLNAALTAASAQIRATVNQICSSMVSAFTAAFAQIVSTAATAMAQVVAIVHSALAQVQQMTGQFSAAMVGHSLWTDMLDEMRKQTTATLGGIAGDFASAFEAVTLAAPTMAAPGAVAARVTAEPVRAAERAEMTITIPVTVTLDGYTIAEHVEKRIVTTLNFRGTKVA